MEMQCTNLISVVIPPRCVASKSNDSTMHYSAQRLKLNTLEP
ncbi:unnamed protein product [Amoebophrya sp. A120]|nr:unnamed protein product [Amoebophrya sp. A120]|eukprot:GSA120T00025205001.1